MSAHTTKTGVYEDTPFGVMAISRGDPAIGRLFGFEADSKRLFLGRTRTPPARVDLFVHFEHVDKTGKDTLVGFVSVFQLLTLADQSDEVSRLHKFAIEQVIRQLPSGITPRPEYFLVDVLPDEPLEESSTRPTLHKSEKVADLLAVALLIAAG